MPLPSLPQDKANHVVYGAAVGLVAYATSLALHGPHPVAVSMTVVAVMAVLKEVNDWRLNLAAKRAGFKPPHGVELMDAVATLAGGAVVAVTAMLPTWVK